MKKLIASLALLSLLYSCKEDEKVIPKVAAPSGFVVKSVSGSQIGLEWKDNSDNETGFLLERSEDSLRFEEVELPPNTNFFIDKNLTPSTKYHYRIASVLGEVVSTRIPLSAATLGLNAPSNFTATAVNYTRVDLKWTDNSLDESGFKLERSTDNKNYNLIDLPANTTEYSDNGLAGSTKYYYRLSAISPNLNSQKATATATTLEATFVEKLQGKWFWTGLSFNGEIQSLQECDKDNSWTFLANKDFIMSDGPKVCLGWDEQGTWALNASNTEITITIDGEILPAKIIELSTDTLVLDHRIGWHLQAHL